MLNHKGMPGSNGYKKRKEKRKKKLIFLEKWLLSQVLLQIKLLLLKNINRAELQEHKDNGLIFNCDKRFEDGHQCEKLFLIISYFYD